MTIHWIAISALLILISLNSVGQANHWQNSTNWKIHDVKKREAFRMPVDSVANTRSIKLDDDKLRYYLSKAKALSKESNYFWIGLFSATYEIEPGKTQKVIFSNYGGFLYDMKTKSYYAIPEDYRKEWLDYLNEKVTEMNANAHEDGNTQQ